MNGWKRNENCGMRSHFAGVEVGMNERNNRELLRKFYNELGEEQTCGVLGPVCENQLLIFTLWIYHILFVYSVVDGYFITLS